MVRLSRQDSQARTRAELVATARDLFLADGLAGTSLDRVAETAGYSKGAVYANFGSKTELCVEALGLIHEAKLAELIELAGSSDPLDERLARFRAWAERTLGDVGWTMLEFEITVACRFDPQLRAQLSSNFALIRGSTEALLTSLTASTGRTLPLPFAEAAEAVLSLGIGLGIQRAIDPSVSTDLLDTILRSLLDYAPAPTLNSVQNMESEPHSNSGANRRGRKSSAALLAAARTAFAARRFEDVSIAEIAAAAGAATGSINYHFGSKRGLYLAVLDAVFADFWARLQQLHGPAIERLAAALDIYLDFAEQQPGPFLAMTGTIDDDLRALRERQRSTIITAVTTEFAAGPPTPIVTAALSGWIGFVEAATGDWIRDRVLPREQLRDLMMANLRATALAVIELDPGIPLSSRAINALLSSTETPNLNREKQL